MIRRDFVLDQRDNPGIRRIVDDFEEPGMINFSSTLAAEQIALGSQADLAMGTNVGAPHRGGVMQVRWGGVGSGGDITWELEGGAAADITDISFLSLRIGQELVLNEDDFASCSLLATDPHREALGLKVRLEDSQAVIAEAALGPIIQQHSQRVKKAGSTICSASQFMSTIRIPMSAFCQTPGFDIASVVTVTIEFPEVMHDVGVYLDTLELTSHPLDEDSLCI